MNKHKYIAMYYAMHFIHKSDWFTGYDNKAFMHFKMLILKIYSKHESIFPMFPAIKQTTFPIF